MTLFLILALALGPTSARAAPPLEKSTATVQKDSDFDQFEGDFGAKAKEAAKVPDPLRGYNRFMFHVNDKFYWWIAKPLLYGYRLILPQPARVAIGRAFENLAAPLRMVNHGLQGNADAFGSEMGRFILNSTLGVGGLWDPSEKLLGAKQIEADFGQTMGHYGLGYGFPVVLPVLGQSNLRDGIGIIPNFAVNPVYYAATYPQYLGVTVGGQFNFLSLHGPEYEKITHEALDPYIFIRDAHLQYREKLVKDSLNVRRYQ